MFESFILDKIEFDAHISSQIKLNKPTKYQVN